MFVDDGSRDNTWKLIKDYSNKSDLFAAVKLSRNKGHQNALLVGLLTAVDYADMLISMDADLQDDVNVIEQMVDDYYKGSEIVYGVRSSRQTDTFLKRFTAETYYKLMSFLGSTIGF